MDRPGQFIERYRRWAYDLRSAFRALSPEKDYRYWFDPFWVRAEPYRVSLRPDGTAEVTLHVRNFRRGRQTHRIEIHAPPGLIAEPRFWKVQWRVTRVDHSRSASELPRPPPKDSLVGDGRHPGRPSLWRVV